VFDDEIGVVMKMGMLVLASCPCGHSTMLHMGFGKDAMVDSCNGPNYHLVPAYCPSCKKIAYANEKERDNRCDQCAGKIIRYGRNKKVSKDREDVLGRHEKTSVSHLCPDCQNFTLSFEDVGNWDWISMIIFGFIFDMMRMEARWMLDERIRSKKMLDAIVERFLEKSVPLLMKDGFSEEEILESIYRLARKRSLQFW
jgi:predicted RNA-binding Zn-ribbon protein involved in translation (DUF1610 family)